MKTNGRRKCDILKDIRKQIAEENGVPFTCHECHETRECAGTCPLCDAEVKQLESEIEKKSKKGGLLKPAAAITVTALLSTTALTSCWNDVGQTRGTMPPEDTEGISVITTYVDSSMVGQKYPILYYDEQDDSVKTVEITLTDKMIGEDLDNPDSTSNVWKAVEEARKKKSRGI